jgi:hypothetical protein
MKKYISVILIVFAVLFTVDKANAQCKGFFKNLIAEKMSPYIHDGNYNSSVLYETKVIDIVQTFNGGQSYRVVVSGSDKIPPVELKVLDKKGKLIYRNVNYDRTKVWDFKVESTQKMTIQVKVPSSDREDKWAKGCVAVLIGFKV